MKDEVLSDIPTNCQKLIHKTTPTWGHGRKNNNGPRTDPPGTSASILDHEETRPFHTTQCFPIFKKSMRVLKVLPDIPFCFNLKIKPLCHSLSKAFNMSENTDWTSWWSSKDLQTWWVIDKSWLIHRSPGLKPDWYAKLNYSWWKTETYFYTIAFYIFCLKLVVKK